MYQDDLVLSDCGDDIGDSRAGQGLAGIIESSVEQQLTSSISLRSSLTVHNRESKRSSGIDYSKRNEFDQNFPLSAETGPSTSKVGVKHETQRSKQNNFVVATNNEQLQQSETIQVAEAKVTNVQRTQRLADYESDGNKQQFVTENSRPGTDSLQVQIVIKPPAIDNTGIKQSGLKIKLDKIRQNIILPVQVTASAVKVQPVKRGQDSVQMVADEAKDDVNNAQRHDDPMNYESSAPTSDDIVSIDTDTAIHLKKLCFGSAVSTLPDSWLRQGFFVGNQRTGLPYAFVQKYAGKWAPSGVLACVQAHFIKHLYLCPSNRSSTDTKLTDTDKREALSAALGVILWRAGQGTRAVVALRGVKSNVASSGRFKHDGITEALVLKSCHSLKDTVAYIAENVKQFEVDGGGGVVLALYSAVLSYTLDRCRSRMASGLSSLLIPESYNCTQELINLLLAGSSVSGTVNGAHQQQSKEVGDDEQSPIDGIAGRCDVGYLTVEEFHNRRCEVGSFLKTPRSPVWVIRMAADGGRFGVLFSTRLEILTDWRAERKFEALFCGGQPHQQSEARITVDSSSQSFYRTADDESTVYDDCSAQQKSEIEMCILTKWKHAELHWNGADPNIL